MALTRMAAKYVIGDWRAAKRQAERGAKLETGQSFGPEFAKWIKHQKHLPRVLFKTRTMSDSFVRGARKLRDGVRSSFFAQGFGQDTGRLKKAMRGKGVRATKASAAERSQHIFAWMRYAGRGSGAQLAHVLDKGTKQRKTKAGANRGRIKASNFVQKGIDSSQRESERAIAHHLSGNREKLTKEANEIARHVVT